MNEAHHGGPRIGERLGETFGTEENVLDLAHVPTHTHQYEPQLVVAAPEPVMLSLFGVGLAGLGLVTRRRRRA